MYFQLIYSIDSFALLDTNYKFKKKGGKTEKGVFFIRLDFIL